MRKRLALGAVTAGLLVWAAPADAAIDFKPCPTPEGVECALVEVPIDRSGTVPGTLSLLVHRIKAKGPATKPPVVALAGGPGQTNTNFTTRFPNELGRALDDRDLIVFDQRGTGVTALECPELGPIGVGPPPPADVQSCAEKLGPSRNFFTTRDSADDLEEIRKRLEVDKLALWGQSYGTWLQQGYAIRHPAHVESMVLDSTVGPEELADPFLVYAFKAAPAVTRAICARGRCKGISTDLFGQSQELIETLLEKPVEAKVVDPDGKVREAGLNAFDVALLLTEIDVDGHVRAELPRAIAHADRGDPAPLARLVAGGAEGPEQPDLGEENPALFLATTCEESDQGFDRGTASPDERLAQARQRLASIPPSTFDPFGPELAFATSFVGACAYWPLLPDPPAFGPGPPADVPVLLVHGEFDLRTPLSSTQEVAAVFAQSKTLTVPNAGHSATTSDVSGCASGALAAFFRSGTSTTTCKRRADPFRPRPLVPGSLRKVKPARGFPRSAGRVVAATQLTVEDALFQLGRGSRGEVGDEARTDGGGLRGGSFKGSSKGPRLVRYELVRGVRISGRVTPRGAVTLTVPGGKLRFAANGRVTGRLRGKPVAGRARLPRLTIAAQLERRGRSAAAAKPVAIR